MAQALYSPSFFMKLAVIVSVGAHVIVLAVRFVPPAINDFMKRQDLEVILVNGRTETKPLNAKVLAQADVDGGGNTDQNVTMSSPLPSLEDGARNQELEDARKRVVEAEQKNQQYLEALTRTQPAMLSGDQLKVQPKEQSSTSGDAEADKAREMQMLLAKISKNTITYQSRPRRTVIGARAKSVANAQYIERLRTKIDKVGTDNFPAEIRKKKLYNSVMLEIEIKYDGTLVLVKVIKKSPSPLLDKAAVDIVTKSAPFPPFSKEMRQDSDHLILTRFLTFTSANELQNSGGD